MIIKAKLKGDKEPREISFTGHGENDPEAVAAVFKKIHPDGEFVEIVSHGLDRGTGRIHVPGEQSTQPVVSHTINAHDSGLVSKPEKE